MTPRLSLLLSTTALTMALGLSALAAMPTQGTASGPCSGVCAAVFSADDLSVPLIHVSHDDDDSDEDDDCDDDDDDDDDDNCADLGRQGKSAPAGSVAPPANGLLGTGAPPVAVTR